MAEEETYPREVSAALERLNPDQVARPVLERLGIRCRPIDLIERRFAIWLEVGSEEERTTAVLYGSIAGVRIRGHNLCLIPHPVRIIDDDADIDDAIKEVSVETQLDHMTWRCELWMGPDSCNLNCLLTLY